MIAGYKYCVSKANYFSCYAVLVKAPYGHMLQSPEAIFVKRVLEEKLMNKKEISIHADFCTLKTRRFLNDLLSCSVDHNVAKLTLPH
jgi:hypothetical protein